MAQDKAQKIDEDDDLAGYAGFGADSPPVNSDDLPEDNYNEDLDEQIPEHDPEHDDRREVAEKPKSKFIKYLVAGLFVTSLPVGYLVLQGFLNQPPPAPEVTMPPPAPAPVAPPPPPVEEPGGYDPALDPALDINGQPVSGQPGVTPDPNLTGQTADVTGGVPASALPNTVAPITNSPQLPGTSGATTPTYANTNAIAPVFNVPASATSAATPAPNMSAGAVKPATANTVAVNAPVATPVAALPVTPDPASNAVLLDRINKLEARVDVLEGRVDIHRDWLAKIRRTAARLIEGSDVKKDESVVAEVKPEPKPRPIRKTPKVTAEAKSDSFGAKSSAVNSTSVSVAPALVPAASVAPATLSTPPAIKGRASYALTAAVPGRAHIQSSEGTRIDITVGDNVPSCGRVNKIDADAGEVITDGCTIR